MTKNRVISVFLTHSGGNYPDLTHSLIQYLTWIGIDAKFFKSTSADTNDSTLLDAFNAFRLENTSQVVYAIALIHAPRIGNLLANLEKFALEQGAQLLLVYEKGVGYDGFIQEIGKAISIPYFCYSHHYGLNVESYKLEILLQKIIAQFLYHRNPNPGGIYMIRADLLSMDELANKFELISKLFADKPVRVYSSSCEKCLTFFNESIKRVSAIKSNNKTDQGFQIMTALDMEVGHIFVKKGVLFEDFLKDFSEIPEYVSFLKKHELSAESMPAHKVKEAMLKTCHNGNDNSKLYSVALSKDEELLPNTRLRSMVLELMTHSEDMIVIAHSQVVGKLVKYFTNDKLSNPPNGLLQLLPAKQSYQLSCINW